MVIHWDARDEGCSEGVSHVVASNKTGGGGGRQAVTAQGWERFGDAHSFCPLPIAMPAMRAAVMAGMGGRSHRGQQQDGGGGGSEGCGEECMGHLAPLRLG